MAAETTKEAIEVVGRAMDLYNKVLDKVMPSESFNEKLIEMNKHLDEYSVEVKDRLATIKVLMSDGINAYTRSTQSIYDWTSTVIPFLQTYIQLFDKNTADDAKAQKTILLDLLDKGINSMTNAQTDLGISSSSFNDAAGKLTSVRIIFSNELKSEKEKYQRELEIIRRPPFMSSMSGSLPALLHNYVVETRFVPEIIAKLDAVSKFYDTMEETVVKVSEDIDETKSRLNDEIRIIGDLKVETQNTQVFVDMDATLEAFIIEAAQGLIDKCYEFRRKHTK